MASAQEIKSGSTAAGPRRSSGLFEIIAFVARASEVARQRRALLKLGDSALKDFGASRADALNEGTKPWWDIPQR